MKRILFPIMVLIPLVWAGFAQAHPPSKLVRIDIRGLNGSPDAVLFSEAGVGVQLTHNGEIIVIRPEPTGNEGTIPVEVLTASTQPDAQNNEASNNLTLRGSYSPSPGEWVQTNLGFKMKFQRVTRQQAQAMMKHLRQQKSGGTASG